MTIPFRGRGRAAGPGPSVVVALILALAGGRGVHAGAAEASARPAGSPAGVTLYGPLAELPAGHWAYAALEELVRAGLVVEYAPGLLLDSERTISRYEAAMLLVDAFRRADAVGSAPETGGGLKALLPDRLLAGAGLDKPEGRPLREILSALGREFAAELKVLGFAMDGAGQEPGASSVRPLEVRPTALLSVRTGPKAADAGPAPAAQEPSGTSAAPGEKPPDAGVTAPGDASGSRALPDLAATRGASVAPSYRLGVRSVVPGLWDLDGQLDLSGGASTEVGAVLLGPMPDRWLWARVGRVWTPLNSAFAFGGDEEALSLQGIEARVVGNQTRTGLVFAQETGQGALPGERPEKSRAIAVLDGSLALSRQVVVGGAIIRGGESPTGLLRLDEGSTVTSVVGRYTPLPWLSFTGEYAQNLWAMPLIASAMRLGATLDFGEVKLGARVDRIHPGFQPALGSIAPGAEVGVDASVRLGDVQLRAGAGRRQPSGASEGEAVPPEFITSVGLQVGWLPGTTVRADYELISVDDLAEGRRPDRARTRVSLDWGKAGAQVQMGLEWGAGSTPSEADQASRLEANAAVSYQLSPYAAVMLGYRLIDFGESAPARTTDATARLTLRF